MDRREFLRLGTGAAAAAPVLAGLAGQSVDAAPLGRPRHLTAPAASGMAAMLSHL